MKILLIKNIAKLGVAGEIKEVSDGYASNFLLRQGAAILASKKNAKEWQCRSNNKSKVKYLSQEKIDRLKQRLSALVLKLNKAANDKGHLFAKVSQADISALLYQQNITIKDKDILLPVIKETGQYQIEIKISDSTRFKVALYVSPVNKFK